MKAPNWIIRPARTSDAEELSDLAFRSKAHWGYSEAFMEACRGELTYTPEQITSNRFRFAVAEEDGCSVGFCALKRLSPDEVELDALFVRPKCIGMGYGRALIEHAKRMAANMGAGTLIIQGDPNAERFYRAAGAVLVGRRESGSIRGRYLPVFRVDLAGKTA